MERGRTIYRHQVDYWQELAGGLLEDIEFHRVFVPIFLLRYTSGVLLLMFTTAIRLLISSLNLLWLL